MSDRNTLIEIFLQNNGWGGAERNILAADASFRTYDRLHKDGKSAVLMNAPPPKEKVEPFIKIDKHLRSVITSYSIHYTKLYDMFLNDASFF